MKTALALAALLVASAAAADELPQATQKNLGTLHLSPAIMDGLDKELAVPANWLDQANKEGTVTISGEWSEKEFDILDAPFVERYPHIKPVYDSAREFSQRAVAPLVAFKQGQYLTDVLLGFGGADAEFKAANALEDVTELPGYHNTIDGANDRDGKWAAARLRYWCIGYNTQLVPRAELPKTWDDLLTSPALGNGTLGIGNRPQLWALMLLTVHGKAWTENYLKTFFTVLKPQFRNEGMDALVSLVAAGEIHAALPTAEYSVKGIADEGAPVAWHCPDPVPLAPSQMGILAGNPHPYAARVWTNWMLSREAQLAQFVADGAPPAHKALQRKEFLAYPDEIIGHHLVQGDLRYSRELYAMWDQYWK